MSNEIIKNSSDFIFIYEAIQCNPNGDPDQENKPRMDYETKTNLVTDTRVKRYIRDYLKSKGSEIFVDMEGDSKVSAENKIQAVVQRIIGNEGELEKAFGENKGLLDVYNQIINDKKTPEKVWKEISNKSFKDKDANFTLLSYLVKQKFIDIRLFGSAFAVPGFTKSYTGPIQLNWGYSFNKVELIDSNPIVTIMNDDNSTFGKDYRVHYSLIGFNGSINHNAAKTTGLTVEDVDKFRDAIWESISANPTRSKMNQYPKLYLELIYNDGITNGQFGDLRNYIDVKPKGDLDYKQVRAFNDLEIRYDRLYTAINSNSEKIKQIKIYKSDDVDIKNPLDKK